MILVIFGVCVALIVLGIVAIESLDSDFIGPFAIGAGFWLTYSWIWYKCGLPIELWSLGITMLLAILSVFCFCQWVHKS
jgi:hypothetical protein